jgi:hypothetical protein
VLQGGLVADRFGVTTSQHSTSDSPHTLDNETQQDSNVTMKYGEGDKGDDGDDVSKNLFLLIFPLMYIN